MRSMHGACIYIYRGLEGATKDEEMVNKETSGTHEFAFAVLDVNCH